MKKFYTSVLAMLIISSGVLAQSSNSTIPKKLDKYAKQETIQNNQHDLEQDFNKDAQIELWSDDFSDPSTWLIEHDATACDLDWEIGVGLETAGFAPIASIQSSSASNGYAMIDSDLYGGEQGGSEVEDSWFTTVTPIDLSGNPNVILEFQSFYRKWTFEECYVVISTNNTDWPELDPEYDAESNPNVFRVWPGMDTQDPVINPTIRRIDISAAAGESSTVYVRFHWTGTWGYAWFVDDVKILEQAANDMLMESALASHNGLAHYGRIPESQLYPELVLESFATNFGYDEQTDVTIDITMVDADETEVFNTTSNIEASMMSGDTITYDVNLDFPSPGVGSYNIEYVVTSAEEPDGDAFENNTRYVNMDITSDLYSLDGIGIHDNPNVGRFGTSSGNNGDYADGIVLLSHYDLILEENSIYGLEILISDSSDVGGLLIAGLYDSTDVVNDDVSNAIVTADEVIITQEIIDAGVVHVYFTSPEILAAGSYYAGVELFSDENATDVVLLNDLTIIQFGDESLVYHPVDEVVYSNPNAMAIRLLMSGADAIDEIANEAVLGNIAPNPARDHANVSFELIVASNVEIRVTDMLGKVVLSDKIGAMSAGSHTHRLDLSELNVGSYHYSIITDNGRQTKAMQIVK